MDISLCWMLFNSWRSWSFRAVVLALKNFLRFSHVSFGVLPLECSWAYDHERMMPTNTTQDLPLTPMSSSQHVLGWVNVFLVLPQWMFMMFNWLELFSASSSLFDEPVLLDSRCIRQYKWMGSIRLPISLIQCKEFSMTLCSGISMCVRICEREGGRGRKIY